MKREGGKYGNSQLFIPFSPKSQRSGNSRIRQAKKDNQERKEQAPGKKNRQDLEIPFLKNNKRERGRIEWTHQPPRSAYMNAPRKKYSEIVEQCKQALTVIILSADIIRTRETLSPEGKKCLEEIRSQAWRVNKELKKGE